MLASSMILLADFKFCRALDHYSANFCLRADQCYFYTLGVLDIHPANTDCFGDISWLPYSH